MDQNFLEELFKYHQKANELYVAKLFPKSNLVPEYAYKMLSHNVLAHHIWNCRILEKPYVWNFEHIFDEEDINDIFNINQLDLDEILSTRPLDSIISYSNLKGQKFQSKLLDILMHVSHHYSYHRGQMAYTLRQAGIDPPPTDLIIWRRSDL